jgi:hypothetical protein
LGVRKDLDGKQVRIPGFIVPLAFDKAHRVTRFFLVPYFGACIHFPPPPADQIVYVKTDGISVTSIYNPYSITGLLHVGGVSNGLGAADYTIDARLIEPYRQ